MAFFVPSPGVSSAVLAAQQAKTNRPPPLTAAGVPSVLPVNGFTLSVEQVATPVKALLGNWKLWVALGCLGGAAYLLSKKGWR